MRLIHLRRFGEWNRKSSLFFRFCLIGRDFFELIFKVSIQNHVLKIFLFYFFVTHEAFFSAWKICMRLIKCTLHCGLTLTSISSRPLSLHFNFYRSLCLHRRCTRHMEPRKLCKKSEKTSQHFPPKTEL